MGAQWALLAPGLRQYWTSNNNPIGLDSSMQPPPALNMNMIQPARSQAASFSIWMNNINPVTSAAPQPPPALNSGLNGGLNSNSGLNDLQLINNLNNLQLNSNLFPTSSISSSASSTFDLSKLLPNSISPNLIPNYDSLNQFAANGGFSRTMSIDHTFHQTLSNTSSINFTNLIGQFSNQNHNNNLSGEALITGNVATGNLNNNTNININNTANINNTNINLNNTATLLTGGNMNNNNPNLNTNMLPPLSSLSGSTNNWIATNINNILPNLDSTDEETQNENVEGAKIKNKNNIEGSTEGGIKNAKKSSDNMSKTRRGSIQSLKDVSTENNKLINDDNVARRKTSSTKIYNHVKDNINIQDVLIDDEEDFEWERMSFMNTPTNANLATSVKNENLNIEFHKSSTSSRNSTPTYQIIDNNLINEDWPFTHSNFINATQQLHSNSNSNSNFHNNQTAATTEIPGIRGSIPSVHRDSVPQSHRKKRGDGLTLWDTSITTTGRHSQIPTFMAGGELDYGVTPVNDMNYYHADLYNYGHGGSTRSLFFGNNAFPPNSVTHSARESPLEGGKHKGSPVEPSFFFNSSISKNGSKGGNSMSHSSSANQLNSHGSHNTSHSSNSSSFHNGNTFMNNNNNNNNHTDHSNNGGIMNMNMIQAADNSRRGTHRLSDRVKLYRNAWTPEWKTQVYAWNGSSMNNTTSEFHIHGNTGHGSNSNVSL